MIIIVTVLAYFAALFGFSLFTTRRSDNNTFFKGNRQSLWYLVAFGMIGASISGVTFISVPGMVQTSGMTYLQMCLGFILGYVIVAFVLLPIYYRLELTSIYSYLDKRLGHRTYKTSSTFFLLSKLSSSAVRFYVVCMILQKFVLDKYHIPFVFTIFFLIGLIWLYTRRGGIRTLVYTDSLQTICMLGALLLIIYTVIDTLNLSVSDAFRTIANDSRSQIFVFNDWLSGQNFWKQFLSGVFIVIVMTGLDQDMMQKNLTCKSLSGAKKDMITYGFAFFPVNLLFLSLGILLVLFYQKIGIAPPAGDDLMLNATATGLLGTGVQILFTIGIVAACFSSADSALTSLTTSFCVDICEAPTNEKLRKRTHLGMAIAFAAFILIFQWFNSTSLIDTIYTLVSYTYGPLLGFFAFAMLTKRRGNDKSAPYIAVLSLLFTFLLDKVVTQFTSYHFGYELLMINGLFTFGCLWLNSKGKIG